MCNVRGEVAHILLKFFHNFKDITTAMNQLIIQAYFN